MKVHRYRPLFLQEVEYHKELNDKIWDGDKLRKEVREKLLNIAQDFIRNQEIDVKIYDIELTGSLANYNYTKYSDLDTHILFSFKEMNEDVDLVKDAMDGKRFAWNTKHDITIHGFEVELYIQEKDEPHVATGLYSLMHDKWITHPTYNPPDVDDADVQMKFDKIVDEIDRLDKIVKSDPETCHKRGSVLKEKIAKMRQEGLEKEGEFSVGNLAFKKLRNTDEIERLGDITDLAYDNVYTEK